MLRFGTAGKPISSNGSTSASGVARVRELGLTCMELEWVHRAPGENSKTLPAAKREAEKTPRITLSCHATYYINFAGDQKIVEASKQRLIRAIRSLVIAGGRNVVFHAGFYKKQDPKKVHEIIRNNLLDVISQLDNEGIKGYCLRPETTGKPTQYGSLDEIIRLSSECPNTAPCIDFSHLHAREGGGFNSKYDFIHTLESIEKGLGNEALSDMHMHVSGIEYTPKGERKHLILRKSDMKYTELLAVLKEYNVGGTLICESPNLEGDAMLMRNYYNQL